MSNRFILRPLEGKLLEAALTDLINLKGIYITEPNGDFVFYSSGVGLPDLGRKMNTLVESRLYACMSLTTDQKHAYVGMVKEGKPPILAMVDTVEVRIVGFMPNNQHKDLTLARISRALTPPKVKPPEPPTPLAKGVYIHLFHGRKDPNQDMDDWGHNGPVLGPFDFAHSTYGCDIKLSNEVEAELRYVDDMVYYDGYYYGDWSVFDVHAINAEPGKYSVMPFEKHKAKLPDNIADIVRGEPAIQPTNKARFFSGDPRESRVYLLEYRHLVSAVHKELVRLGAKMHADTKPEDLDWMNYNGGVLVRIPIKDGV